MNNTKTDFNIKVSIETREVNDEPGYDISVVIGDIKKREYFRYSPTDISAHIGNLITKCFVEYGAKSIIRLNNMKAFD